MRPTCILLLILLRGGPTVCMAQAPADFTPAPFTPPGPNIALHKHYTLEPAPTYGDCSLDPGRALLTDGTYTQGYFWVQKTSVGWVHSRPVVITIDLGRVEPVAGLSYSTAAGVAGVDEAADGLGDGRLGQAGPGGQVRARAGALVEHGPEDVGVGELPKQVQRRPPRTTPDSRYYRRRFCGGNTSNRHTNSSLSWVSTTFW